MPTGFVFLSHSRSDERLASMLNTQLAAFREYQIDVITSASCVTPGGNRRVAVRDSLDRSDIAVVLISSDYLEESAQPGHELFEILDRQRTAQLLLVPVIARPCAWQSMEWLCDIEVFPHDGFPLSTAAVEVVDERLSTLATCVAGLLRSPRSLPPPPGAPRGSGEPPAIMPAPIRFVRMLHLAQRSMARPLDLSMAPNDDETPPKSQALMEVLQLEALLLEREKLLKNRVDLSSTDLNVRLDKALQEVMTRRRPVRGDLVAGATLLSVIGHGNFATIWQSRDVHTGELRATKIFHPEKLGTGIMLWRFRRSIQAMMLLGCHRDVPETIVRLRSVADNTLAFSMDFLAGGDLEHIAQQQWSIEEKLKHFVTICEAVSFGHCLGIIHRDIKPTNIVLSKDGRPTLTDFDIADIKFVTTLSVAQGGLGTPVFAAPEQLVDAEAATEQSDIYSLGRLLHFMLIERSPGLHDNGESAFSSLDAVPRPLVAIIRKATDRTPVRRHESVEELIREVNHHRSTRAIIRARLGDGARWIKHHLTIVLVLSLVFLAGGALLLLEHQHAVEMSKVAEDYAAIRDELDRHQREVDSLLSRRETLSTGLSRLMARSSEAKTEAEQQRINEELLALSREIYGINERIAALKDEGRRLTLEAERARQRLRQGRPPVVPRPVVAAEPSGPTRPAGASELSGLEKCRYAGQSCDADSDCCSRTCASHSCAAPAVRGGAQESCRAWGVSCGDATPCCAGYACIKGTCLSR